MSELSDTQIKDFEARLDKLKAALEEELEGAREAARPVDLDLPIGRITRMDAMQDQQMAMARVRRIERRLRATEAALTRIQLGTYGTCPACEEPINTRRLEMRPEIVLCMECQDETLG